MKYRNKAPIEEKSALFKCLESKLLMFIFLEVGLKCHLQSKLTFSQFRKDTGNHRDY